MGNSEVGHLNLGAGAVLRQDLTRIDDAVHDGTLAHNRVVRDALAGPGRVHLLGLVSDGGVHSSLEHLLALVAIARELEAGEVVVHCFTDGRDTAPHAALEAIRTLERAGGARVGSVIGRYWAMDRDRRWDRTQRAYDLLVGGRAPFHAATGVEAVAAAYERGETDEFIEPTLVGAPAPIAPGDRVFCFNFRPDRMRQLVRALAEPGFAEVDRGGAPPVAALSTLTEYEEGWPYPVAFAPERPATTLSAVIAASGARQLHVAETEKYPHVTYFFNGGEEQPLPGERRELVPSPRDVPTYDHKPEMSAQAAADAFVGRLGGGSAALRGDQLRQPRHGRAHRGDRGRGARGRGGRRMPGRGRARGARERRRLHRHGRPWQLRGDARGRRQPADRALALAGPADRDDRRGAPGARRDPRRRGADRARAARHPQPPAMTGRSLCSAGR